MSWLVDFTGFQWGRASAQSGGPASLEFISGGLTRTASYIGNTTDPSVAWVWLDGGDEAVGENILANLTPDSTEVFVAPDGLTHLDGTSTWIKRWTPDPAIRASGASESTDVQMLVDLVTVIQRSWPSVGTLYLGGYSGGAGLVQEFACLAASTWFDGYFVFKRPLHERQVNLDGSAILTTPLIPLMLWMGANDEHNLAEDHVGRGGTVYAYAKTYTGDRFGSHPVVSKGTQTTANFLRSAYKTLGGNTRLTYIHEIRGDHAWVEGCESVARRFFRGGDT